MVNGHFVMGFIVINSGLVTTKTAVVFIFSQVDVAVIIYTDIKENRNCVMVYYDDIKANIDFVMVPKKSKRRGGQNSNKAKE